MQLLRRHRRNGFSAIEIIVVLLIISIFSAFAVISYRSYRSQAKISTASQKVESVLSTARALSINQNTPHQVYFDLDSEHFWIDELDRTGNVVKPKITGETWLPEGVVFSHIQKNIFPYTSGVVTVRFNPNSTSEYITVYIIGENSDTSEEGNYYSIRVYPSTGLTHTYKKQRL